MGIFRRKSGWTIMDEGGARSGIRRNPGLVEKFITWIFSKVFRIL